MATSGSYIFQSPQVEQVITDAYERIKIYRDDLTSQQIKSAQRSLNFILSSWPNRGLNLWTIKKEMMALYPNKGTYTLPTATSDVLEAVIRTSTRNLNGAAFSSSGGVPGNAFDGNTATACTQIAPNGNIGYNWNGSQFAINLVGVQSNATLTYTLSFEFSNDSLAWTEVLAPVSQTYPAGSLIWFEIPVPQLGSYFRVREEGGSTLNIQELYFNTTLNDTVLERISRDDWVSYSNKFSTGMPSCFWIDRGINPTLTLYYVPDTTFNNLFYTRIEMPEDVGDLTNTPAVPARFLQALTSELSGYLAIKEEKLDRVDLLFKIAEKEFALASKEDVEKTPLRIYGNYRYGWTKV